MDRSPSCGAGDRLVPANGTHEELRRLARPCVLSIADRSGIHDFTKRQPKISGGSYARNVIRTYWRPAMVVVTRDRAGSRLKGHHHSSIGGETEDQMKSKRLRNKVLLTAVRLHQGRGRTPWRKLGHGA